MTHRIGFVLIGALLSACTNTPAPADAPPPQDTNTTDEPEVLPIDTSVFIPNDTAGDAIPDITPDHWVYLLQQGTWNLSGSPYSDLAGTMRIREYIDELDTALANPYVCDVTYSLTGSAVQGHTCSSCDYVFEVEHFVTAGDPGACRDPDTPTDGSVWQLGYAGGSNTIFLNYFGTDVWLEWYDTTSAPPTVAFNWSATLAIEVEDTADDN